MRNNTIMIATPHPRYDALVSSVRSILPLVEVHRSRGRQEILPEALAKLSPAWIFFPHWSWLIPETVHTRYNCVIFHMTDLPYGRGGSPLQNLIVRGHNETQITALKCVAGLDAGPVFAKVPLALNGTAEEILQRAAGLMVGMIVDIVGKNPNPTPQTGTVVEFKRRQPSDGDIADLETLTQAYDHIRMLDAEGYPPAFLQTRHLHCDFTNARLTDDWVEATVRIRRRDHE